MRHSLAAFLSFFVVGLTIVALEAIFLAANPMFPSIKIVGKTKGGADLKRYIRTEVEAYRTLFNQRPDG